MHPIGSGAPTSTLSLEKTMPTQATAEKIIPISEAKTQTPEILKSKGYQRPILEILADLQKPIPKRFIKSKTLKGQRIDFVSWYTATFVCWNTMPLVSPGKFALTTTAIAPSSKVVSPSAPPKATLSAKPPEPKITKSIAGATHPATPRRWR
jgi:hypothetical protein